MSSKSWNWPNNVMPLALAVLRVCWLWPWLTLLQRWLTPSHPGEGTLMPITLVLGLLLGGLLIARQALTSLPLSRARAVVAGTGLVVIFLVLWWQLYRETYPLWNIRWAGAWGAEMTDWDDWEIRGVPAPIFVMLATSYVWMRGILDGRKLSLTRDDVWRTFVIGFIALVIVLAASQIDNRGLPPATVNLVWAFFAVGMVALALAGLQVAGGLEMVRGADQNAIEASPRFDRYWLVSVLSIIVALLVVGLALSALIAPEAVAQVLGVVLEAIGQVFILLIKITSIILYPILYALSKIVPTLLQRFYETAAPIFEIPESPDPQELKPEESNGIPQLIDSLPNEFRVVMLVVFVAAIGLLFVIALRRLLSGSRTRGGIEETRELVFSSDLLQQQLADLWHHWLGRLGRAKAVTPFLSLHGEVRARRVIRAVYQALLAAAQERGSPRARGRTPLEYQRELEKEWPPGESLGVITASYVQARYDSEPPPVEQAQRVRRAWEQLQASWKVQDD